MFSHKGKGPPELTRICTISSYSPVGGSDLRQRKLYVLSYILYVLYSGVSQGTRAYCLVLEIFFSMLSS